MASILNSFESPASGTQLANGNGSNADGSTAWSGATIGAGGTLVTSTTHVHNGSQSLKVASGATAAASYAEWLSVGPFNTGATTMWGRLYCYFTAIPSDGVRLCGTFASNNGTSAATGVNVNGHVVTNDAAGNPVTTSSLIIPLNQWIRLEFKHVVSATVGQTEVKIFTSPEATSPAETNTSTANLNTGFNPIAQARIGQVSANANTGPVWIDDVAFSDTGYLGPLAHAVSMAGPVVDVAIAAPTGAISPSLNLAGAAVNVAIAAPAGALGGLTTITGPTAAVAIAGPPGTLVLGRNLIGPTAGVTIVAPDGILGRRLNTGPVVDVSLAALAGRVIIIPPHIFRPPTVKQRPVDPQGERLWLYYGVDVGISVIKRQDGTYYQQQWPTPEEMDASLVTYMGGHEYQVDDAEYAALIAAGYLDSFDNPLDDGGYGNGAYGAGVYGG